MSATLLGIAFKTQRKGPMLVQPGLFEALKPHWRGGVTCRVISGGVIHTDMPVVLSSVNYQ